MNNNKKIDSTNSVISFFCREHSPKYVPKPVKRVIRLFSDEEYTRKSDDLLKLVEKIKSDASWGLNGFPQNKDYEDLYIDPDGGYTYYGNISSLGIVSLVEPLQKLLTIFQRGENCTGDQDIKQAFDMIHQLEKLSKNYPELSAPIFEETLFKP